jgi:hypothetical protein
MRRELQQEATGAEVPGLLTKAADRESARLGFETPDQAAHDVEGDDAPVPDEPA